MNNSVGISLGQGVDFHELCLMGFSDRTSSGWGSVHFVSTTDCGTVSVLGGMVTQSRGLGTWTRALQSESRMKSVHLTGLYDDIMKPSSLSIGHVAAGISMAKEVSLSRASSESVFGTA